MRLCFLVEEHYRHDGMPKEVIRQLTAWGHQVDVVRPGGSLVRVSEAVAGGQPRRLGAQDGLRRSGADAAGGRRRGRD